MEKQKKLPIIIGSGISGFAISRKLAMEKIHHILIGAPIKVVRPILGESVEMLGVSILKELFPELSQHFHPKLGINYHINKSQCHFDFIRCFKIPDIIELMKETKYTHKAHGSFSLVHLDRALFDHEAFNAVIQSPYCHYMNEKVVGYDYDVNEDVIKSISMESGNVLYPSFVYDATSAAQILARALKLQPEYISKNMRVVFAHYKVNEQSKALLNRDMNPWIYNTEILRHYQQESGFEGSSWCIPIGDHISIGTNVLDNVGLSDDEILQATHKAYACKGIDYTSVYPEKVAEKSLASKLYYYPKMFGRNWVLTSGAAGLTWYTAQTGVESAMFIASIADRVLQYPQYYCAYYQEFIMQQVRMHKIHDWLHYHDYDNVVELEAYSYMINSIRCIQGRYLLGNLCLDHPTLNKLTWLTDIKKYQSELSEEELLNIIASIKRMETCAEYVFTQ